MSGARLAAWLRLAAPGCAWLCTRQGTPKRACVCVADPARRAQISLPIANKSNPAGAQCPETLPAGRVRRQRSAEKLATTLLTPHRGKSNPRPPHKPEALPLPSLTEYSASRDALGETTHTHIHNLAPSAATCKKRSVSPQDAHTRCAPLNDHNGE